MRINRSSNSLDNDDARVLLKQIDEWHVRTIDACCETADETQRIVVRLFSKSTIIDYVANFFANKRTFHNRIWRITISPSYALVTTNMDSYVQAMIANYYQFPIDDR
ncbi:unnamed protein product [Rotaria sordida]|uniref:Uncharacterized protein n=1 Tax=Rotaria sordida TaxID=392033 RepID=A0A814EZE4_9BILA|nr:unnamed protein product [Rotaria sordida]CAF1044126.1 unnamed protein product [Rotaria sordida]